MRRANQFKELIRSRDFLNDPQYEFIQDRKREEFASQYSEEVLQQAWGGLSSAEREILMTFEKKQVAAIPVGPGSYATERRQTTSKTQVYACASALLFGILLGPLAISCFESQGVEIQTIGFLMAAVLLIAIMT